MATDPAEFVFARVRSASPASPDRGGRDPVEQAGVHRVVLRLWRAHPHGGRGRAALRRRPQWPVHGCARRANRRLEGLASVAHLFSRALDDTKFMVSGGVYGGCISGARRPLWEVLRALGAEALPRRHGRPSRRRHRQRCARERLTSSSNSSSTSDALEGLDLRGCALYEEHAVPAAAGHLLPLGSCQRGRGARSGGRTHRRQPDAPACARVGRLRTPISG